MSTTQTISIDPRPTLTLSRRLFMYIPVGCPLAHDGHVPSEIREFHT